MGLDVAQLGQVFTPPNVVAFMLDLCRNTGRVLEPSAGDGAFFDTLRQRGPDVVGIEIDRGVAPEGAQVGDFFAYPLDEQFDTIVGNPPYVRYQDVAIGPNGAGKSTIIRAASGVIPSTGHIRTNGDDFQLLTPLQRARYLAVVPQAISLPPAFTVWETVLMGRTPYLGFLGQASAHDEQLARQALNRVNALAFSDRRVGELSGGERQRVLLARALCQSTPILLLDEPTAHLDLQYQVGLLELVHDLAHNENLAVLVALHDLNLASHYADRVALLVGGHLKQLGLRAKC